MLIQQGGYGQQKWGHYMQPVCSVAHFAVCMSMIEEIVTVILLKISVPPNFYANSYSFELILTLVISWK